MREEDTWTLFDTNAAVRILGVHVGDFAVRPWIIDILQWTVRHTLLLVYKVLTRLH